MSLIAFLQVNNSSATVLAWFVNLVTASQLINFGVMSATFLCWYNALKVQGINRSTLPYRSICQPYAAWLAMTCCIVMAFVGGYTVFLPGNWDVPTFLFSYFMIMAFPVLYVGYKLVMRTKWRRGCEVDLRGEVEEIDEYSAHFVETPPK